MRLKIPYYRVKRGNGFWEPTREMRAAGLAAVACGPDGPAAWAQARAQNQRWRALQQGRAAADAALPSNAIPGSLDEAFRRYRLTREWDGKAARTREEWERAWSRIRPIFGDFPPRAVTLELISAFRARIEHKVSRREAQRCIKIWRALWRVAAALGYCERDADPSLGVRNLSPQARSAVWEALEVWALVKGAWRSGYRGLAALMAVAWDTSLSPVDVRSLTPTQRGRDGQGDVFRIARAKTGRAALGTLSRPASRILDAYLSGIGVTLTPEAAIFRNRSGQPYSKDTLGDDFRAVRTIVFGEGERRTLADFRRSGSVEALRGGADAEALGAKLANNYAGSAELQRTYTPVDLATVRQVDEARKRGRK